MSWLRCCFCTPQTKEDGILTVQNAETETVGNEGIDKIADPSTIPQKAAKKMVKPTATDMAAAKLLYVQLKMDWTANPDVKSPEDLKWVLGDGGATEPWAAVEGLRHKYFAYCPETETCSGVYVFFNQQKLDAYMSSELFAAQGKYPHVSQVTATVLDVMEGTELCIEKTAWGSNPPTREDVSKAVMLIVHLKIDYAANPDCPDEDALRNVMKADGMGYPGAFAELAGLRGKYFVYHKELETCSGFYTFVDRASLDEYLKSDLFSGQANFPHIKEVTFSVHEVCPGTERAMDLGDWGDGDRTTAPEKAEEVKLQVKLQVKPTATDMAAAKLLYVQLKMDWTANPDVKSPEDLKWVLGDGGATEPWAAVEGLRHKYFAYCPETETCSGVYVFFNQQKLDAYMSSELFAAQGKYPHVSQVTATVLDVMEGTELCIEKTAWGSNPPTREDVSKAVMLIVHLKIDYAANPDCPDEDALRNVMKADGMGYPGAFAELAGLRGKYFVYHKELETCSGFYTFVDGASLDEYLKSDLFSGQANFPHIKEVTFSVHEVCPGTERAMDLGVWAHGV
ncbi:hypothetical protein CYMTET_23972 [Cymbomonas tetramitiformis]|uniref:Uncharacterized protein n=1 Tax=Cymbomonas tetramitiformis TaxID=36881 RepID=A0AAE0FXF6_9CHLO|nr:hypothetical protein CYMTET_23972 [Cymbomonas tetramitiformis]